MQLRVMPHSVAVAADVDDVTMMDEPVDQCRRHHLVAKDLPPFLKALVRGEYRRGVLVAATHELEEEHGPGVADREIADLVDDEQRGKAECLHPVQESARLTRLLERGDEIAQGAVVDAPPALGRGDRETEREVRLADARRPQKDHVFLSLEEPERVQTVELLPLDRRLKG